MFTQGLIPGTIDLGITERLARNPGLGWLGLINNPAVNLPKQPSPANQIPQNQLSNFSFGGTNPATLNYSPPGEVLGDKTNSTLQRTTNTNNVTQPTNNSGIFDNILGTADKARQDAMARASSYLDSARSIFGQGMDLLGQKRDQFKKMFDDTSSDILTGYESNRGQLQTSAQNEDTRTANALRALGLGGSADVRAKGRQAQENARALSGVQQARVQGDRANTNNLNEQNMWAAGQENQLQNYLQSANDQKSALESNAGIDFENIVNQIAQQEAALRSSAQNIGGFQFNPADITALLNANTDVQNPALGTNTGLSTNPADINSAVSISPQSGFFDTIIKKLLGR